MYLGKSIALLLPARNEALALPYVLRTVPPEIDSVLVIDNGSTDSTRQVAKEHGAQVVSEPMPGYGRACLAGINALANNPPDIVAFADADGSDDLSKLCNLIDTLINENADLVLEKRVTAEHGALSQQQRFGNWLAITLIRLFWRHSFSDLGPMRIIYWKALLGLKMKDKDFGWTIEMQIRAIRKDLKILELPVPYRKRTAGRSKISRTTTGTIRAGSKIIWVILREALLNGTFFSRG